MKQGYVKLYRKTLSSPIFAHEGMLKLFLLCLMKANHQGAEVSIPGVLEPIKLKPGQFITGRYSIHEDYHQAHIKKRYSRKAAPTPITIYRWLLTLEKMQILHIKSYNKYSIITVINWHQYQENEQQVNNRRTSDEHKQELIENEKETPKKISSEISLLRSRYSDQDLIDQAFQAISSTRKGGKVAESVLLAQLKKWERFPLNQVEAAIRVYLERDCASEGKREEYLYGIIRRQKDEPRKECSTPDWY